MTETDLINMRRTIYLTIMNSLNFEEAVHKLLNVQIPPGNEVRSLHIPSYAVANHCCAD
jgi:pre-mRNA-splicing factor CWC22